jgi:hypothetical protein
MKNSTDTIGNRTRDPPACSAVPLPTAPHGPEFEFRCGRDVPQLSRPTLGPTQHSVQWAPGLFLWVKSGRGVALTTHSHLAARLKKD